MKIKLSTFSDAELIRLISLISTELESRLRAPFAPETEAEAEAMMEPSRDDKDYCLRIKTRLESGSYILAAERERVAAIASEYPQWVARQGLPADKNTGSWRTAKNYHSIKPANER